ncbi:MAG: RNA polymerase sigma factor [Vicinamibacterales bacterium]
MQIPAALLDRVHRKADAGRWQVPPDQFAQALEASAAKALGDRPSAGELSGYLERLHLADLALACACANGHDDAWEHFVREVRPGLYRAADAIDRTGGARELADGLYADLFGVNDQGQERRSLFRYYHGRSSLSTWLRAVLAQRHVDRLRETQRLTPLPEEEPAAPPADQLDPARTRWAALVTIALTRCIAALEPRDRIRLASYYLDGRTLAEIGRMLGEHEATVSRQLARLRRHVRQEVERALAAGGMDPVEVQECLASLVQDPGSLDLRRVLDAQEDRGSIVQVPRGTS